MIAEADFPPVLSRWRSKKAHTNAIFTVTGRANVGFASEWKYQPMVIFRDEEMNVFTLAIVHWQRDMELIVLMPEASGDLRDGDVASLLDDNERLRARVEQLEQVCAEAYQVVGSMASDLGVFEEPCITKALDNLSSMSLLHEDVLPFPSFELADKEISVDQFIDQLRGLGFSTSAHVNDEEVLDLLKIVIERHSDRVPAPAKPQETTQEECYSTNEEDYRVDYADVLTEFLDGCDRDESAIGSYIYKANSKRYPASHFFDIDRLLEDMECRASDEAGEWAEDAFELDKKEKRALDLAIARILDRQFGILKFFIVDGMPEKIQITKEMIDELRA